MVKPQGVLPLRQIVDKPYAARWRCKRSWKGVAQYTIRTYRDQLDCAQEKCFKFNPYPPLPLLPEYCRNGSYVWVKIVPLIFFIWLSTIIPTVFAGDCIKLTGVRTRRARIGRMCTDQFSRFPRKVTFRDKIRAKRSKMEQRIRGQGVTPVTRPVTCFCRLSRVVSQP